MKNKALFNRNSDCSCLSLMGLFWLQWYGRQARSSNHSLEQCGGTISAQSRYDATVGKDCEAYAKHEKETFDAVTKARNAATQIHLDADNLTPEKMKQFRSSAKPTCTGFLTFDSCCWSLSGTESKQRISRLAIQEEGTENRINEARKKYNESVQEYNQTVRHFPNSLLAGIFGFDKILSLLLPKAQRKHQTWTFKLVDNQPTLVCCQLWCINASKFSETSSIGIGLTPFLYEKPLW